MTRTEISRQLRPHRRPLVLAAERALQRALNMGGDTRPPSKTQFSRLVNLCGEATCAEELENYLRYQAGRASRGSGSEKDAWTLGFVDLVLAGIQEVFDDPTFPSGGGDDEQRDLCRVEAWRLYATYLARAFTYQEAKRGHERTDRPQRRGEGAHGQRHRNHQG